MNTLTKERIARKHDLARQLEEAADDLNSMITSYNDQIEASFAALEESQDHYNETVVRVNAFVGEVREVQEAHHDQKAESWQTSADGETYKDWIEEWSVTLSEINVGDRPAAVEDSGIEDAEMIRDLSEQP